MNASIHFMEQLEIDDSSSFYRDMSIDFSFDLLTLYNIFDIFKTDYNKNLV